MPGRAALDMKAKASRKSNSWKQAVQHYQELVYRGLT